jgi:predicted secreted Zn-dependent protease
LGRRRAEVSGSTAKELRQSLDRNRSAGESPFGDGHTLWKVRWSYWYSTGEQCALATLATTVEITITLPRWSPATTPPPDLAARWDAYLRDLRRHEQGHADVGRDAGRAVDRRLRELGPFTDCPQLEAAIQKAGDATILEYSRKDSAYDIRTAHGLVQGAIFP